MLNLCKKSVKKNQLQIMGYRKRFRVENFIKLECFLH